MRLCRVLRAHAVGSCQHCRCPQLQFKLNMTEEGTVGVGTQGSSQVSHPAQ